MTKRSAEECVAEVPLPPPAVRDSRVETLRTLAEMPDCMLNPRVSRASLMCDDVLDLISQCLRAPVLCASIWDAGMIRQWCAYEFDAGWQLPRQFRYGDRCATTQTVQGVACTLSLDDNDSEGTVSVRPLDGSAVLWSTALPSSCEETRHMQAADDALLCFPDDWRQMTRCQAGAKHSDVPVEFPRWMHRSIGAQLVGDRLFWRISYRNPSLREAVMDIALYDLHSNTVSFRADNIHMQVPPTPRAVSLDFVANLVDENSVYCATSVSSYVYDMRSGGLCAVCHPWSTNCWADFETVLVSENFWMVVTSRGTVFEYDRRGDFWRQPHPSLPAMYFQVAMQYRALA